MQHAMLIPHNCGGIRGRGQISVDLGLKSDKMQMGVGVGGEHGGSELTELTVQYRVGDIYEYHIHNAPFSACELIYLHFDSVVHR